MATGISPATTATLAQFEPKLEEIRKSERLTRITDELEGMPISALPEGVYGFSYSQPSDEMPLFAQRQFQVFEWHKTHAGEIRVIGFATEAEAALLEAKQEPVDFNLFPEPHGDATTMVVLQARRIRKAKAPSRSGGNSMSLHTDPKFD